MKRFVLILMIWMVTFSAAIASNDLQPKFSYKTKGLTANFKNKTIGDYTNLLWNFGDGTSSTVENPIHEYGEQGIYTFSLTVEDKEGEEVTFEGKLYVFDTSKRKVKTFKPVKVDADRERLVAKTDGALAKENLRPVSPITKLKTYPNPMTHHTMLSFNVTETTEVQIALFDLSGKMVKQIQSKVLTEGSHEMSIDRDNLPAGTYLIKVNTQRHHNVLKLIIQ